MKITNYFLQVWWDEFVWVQTVPEMEIFAPFHVPRMTSCQCGDSVQQYPFHWGYFWTWFGNYVPKIFKILFTIRCPNKQFYYTWYWIICSWNCQPFSPVSQFKSIIFPSFSLSEGLHIIAICYKWENHGLATYNLLSLWSLCILLFVLISHGLSAKRQMIFYFIFTVTNPENVWDCVYTLI